MFIGYHPQTTNLYYEFSKANVQVFESKKRRGCRLGHKGSFYGKIEPGIPKEHSNTDQFTCSASLYNGNKLHVIADTPAWAAKFRFMSSHILPTLRKNIQYFQYVKEVTVTTKPINAREEKIKKTSPRYLSSEAKSCLENMADALDNKDLQQSLRRLAKRHKKT